jgi:hypothetical protein
MLGVIGEDHVLFASLNVLLMLHARFSSFGDSPVSVACFFLSFPVKPDVRYFTCVTVTRRDMDRKTLT